MKSALQSCDGLAPEQLDIARMIRKAGRPAAARVSALLPAPSPWLAPACAPRATRPGRACPPGREPPRFRGEVRP